MSRYVTPESESNHGRDDPASHLRYTKLFRRALREAGKGNEFREPSEVSSAESAPASNRSFREVCIQCPHCRTRNQFDDDTPPTDIACSGCGNRFSLLDDELAAATLLTQEATTRFDLLERVGGGGFGCVWKSHDAELDRIVALKIPHRGAVRKENFDQVIREARAVAQLNHPNIVPVYEVGRDGDCVFIVSDFVDGVPLSEWLNLQRPTFREAAALCAKVADVLEHAHQKGVIHRDLKPQNIIVDANDEPHLVDFGLARRDVAETITVDGHILGTPAYMSPEQARGEAHQVDGRTDVYSLGVVLFELLTTEMPFRGSAHMILRQLVEDEPPSPRNLNSNIPRDLETICLKCLQKQPHQRYESAKDLADEFGRYLENKPILASPISRIARAVRWCRRNPMASVVLLLVAIVAVVGPLLAASQRTLRREADELNLRLNDELRVSTIRLAHRAIGDGDTATAQQYHSRLSELSDETSREGFEYRYLEQRLRDAAALPRLRHDAAVTSLSFSYEGGLLAVSSGSRIHLWEMPRRKQLPTLEVNQLSTKLLNVENGTVADLAFSPTDQHLLAATLGKGIVLWNVLTGNSQVLFTEKSAAIRRIAFVPDGRLVSGDKKGRISVWDVAERREVCVDGGTNENVMALATYREGFGVASFGGAVDLYDTNDLAHPIRLTLPTAHSSRLAFHPDGRTMVACSDDAKLTYVDLATKKRIATIAAHSAPISSAAYSPQGGIVATAGLDRTVKLWYADSKLEKATLAGHTSEISSLAFAPDGSLLASGSADGEVILWPTGGASAPDLLVHGNLVISVAISPNDALLASVGLPNTIKLWDVASQSMLNEWTFNDLEQIWDVTFDPKGRMLAVGTNQGVIFWDVGAWEQAAPPLIKEDPSNVQCVRFSPGSRLVATTVWNGKEVDVWDVASHELVDSLKSYGAWFGGLAFSPDGKTLAFPREENRMALWDVEAGLVKLTLDFTVTEEMRRKLEVHDKLKHIIRAVAFSPDGRTLAVAVLDQIVIWDVRTSERLGTVACNQGVLESIVFSPDGMRLASSSSAGTIKLWSVDQGRQEIQREVGALYGHTGIVPDLKFSKDGEMLFSGGFDRSIRIWRGLRRSRNF